MSKRKFLWLALIMTIIVIKLSITSASAMTNDEITAKISSFQSTMDEKYWNAGKSESELIAAVNSGNYSFGLTNSACSISPNNVSHHLTEYGCTSNTFNGSRQCAGFAEYMAYVIFGSKTTSGNGWTKYTSSAGITLEPGDIIRYNGHSAMVWYTNGDNLYVAEANWWDNQKRWCQVHFGKSWSTVSQVKSNLTYIWKHPTSGGINPDPPTGVVVTTLGSKVAVSWESSQYATDYDVYLIQAPWGWSDIKYSQNIGSQYKYCQFYGVAPGDYCVFVVARPNADYIQSEWKSISVGVPPAPTINSLNTNNFIVGNNITVSWNNPGNAEKYVYYLTEYPTGYAYTTNTKTEWTANTSVSFSNLSAGHYSMFVHASNDIGSSAQSKWITFNVYDEDYIPTKSVVYNNHIYALYDYEMSWSFARDLCKDMGGHLVTITSSDEENAVESLISNGTKDAYWLGASDIDNSDKVYSWVTDEKFSYSNWKSGEPSATGDKGTKEHFAEIRKSYNNQWNDVNNISKSNKGFILEIEVEDYSPEVTKVYNGHTYMLFDKNTTWSEAKIFCEQVGGHLATAESNDEYNFLKDFLKSGNRLWYYIGGQKNNGTWQWYDGTTAQYISWADNASAWTGTNLMMYKSTGNCIGLNNAYYPENDIKNIGFVCELENSTPIPTEEPETPTPTVKPTNPPVTDGATVKVSNATVSAGGTATVTVDLSGSSGFANLGLEVGYDSSVLTLTEAQNNTNIGAIYTPAQSLTTNPYNFGWNGTSNVDFNGNLITLTFKVADNAAEKTYPITISYYKGMNGSYADGEDVNYDADFNSLDLSYINGSVTVSSHKPGDVNSDGKVNNQDGTYLLRYLAGWSVDIDSSALDINGDGKVNNQDGTVLLRYLAGWTIDIH